MYSCFLFNIYNIKFTFFIILQHTVSSKRFHFNQRSFRNKRKEYFSSELPSDTEINTPPFFIHWATDHLFRNPLPTCCFLNWNTHTDDVISSGLQDWRIFCKHDRALYFSAANKLLKYSLLRNKACVLVPRSLFDNKHPEAMWITTNGRVVIAKASGSCFPSLRKRNKIKVMWTTS